MCFNLWISKNFNAVFFIDFLAEIGVRIFDFFFEKINPTAKKPAVSLRAAAFGEPLSKNANGVFLKGVAVLSLFEGKHRAACRDTAGIFAVGLSLVSRKSNKRQLRFAL